jgi:hypothetical protein
MRELVEHYKQILSETTRAERRILARKQKARNQKLSTDLTGTPASDTRFNFSRAIKAGVTPITSGIKKEKTKDKPREQFIKRKTELKARLQSGAD